MGDTPAAETPADAAVRRAEIPLDRDGFLRSVLRELAGSLQEVVGLEETEGFVSLVGQRIGDSLNASYRTALGVSRLSAEQVSSVLVDLKRRIQGDFYLIEADSERIVLGNRACPFGDRVLDRPSLCMMTSNVFGVITAENLGYARVELEKTIAEGHGGCRIVVHLRPEERDDAQGREYFQS